MHGFGMALRIQQVSEGPAAIETRGTLYIPPLLRHEQAWLDHFQVGHLGK